METKINFTQMIRRWWSLFVVVFVWLAFGLLNMLAGSGEAADCILKKFRRSGDFDSFYAGALCARHQRWDCLFWEIAYTDEQPDRFWPASYDPWLIEQLVKNQVPGINRTLRWHQTRYVYPPQTALLLVPLSWFSFDTARRIWIALNGLALLVFLCMLGRESDDFGIPPITKNLTLLVVGFSFPVQIDYQWQNVSLFSAIAVLALFRGLRLGKDWETLAGLLFLGITKGTSIVWIPLLVIWKKWRLIRLIVGCGLVLLFLPSLAGCAFSVNFVFLKMAGLISLYLPSLENPFYLALELRPESAHSLMTFLWILGCLWIYLKNSQYPLDQNDCRSVLQMGSSLFLSLLILQACLPICWIHYRLLLFAFLPFCMAFVKIKRDLSILFWTGFFLFAMTCNTMDDALFCIPMGKGASWLAYVLWTSLAISMFKRAISQRHDT